MECSYISDYLIRNAQAFGFKKALVTNKRALNWQELETESRRISTWIEEKTTHKQQKIIAILMPNNWEFVVTYFGIIGSGNIAMPIDITYKKLEVDAVINQIKPDLVIGCKQTVGMTDQEITLFEEISTTDSGGYPKIILPPEEQIATLFFSSGTTGKPKAIPNTHKNELWDVSVVSKPYRWEKNDTLLLALPLSHRHGLVVGLLGAIYHGSTIYLEEHFSPSKTLELLSSGSVTMFISVPAVYGKLNEFDENQTCKFKNVRLCASGSSILLPSVKKEFEKKFKVTIIDRYGTTETGSVASNTLSRSIPGTYSYILPGVKIREEADGELAMISPGLFPGYFNNTEATSDKLTKDGWWRTGDIGTLENGTLILKSRIDDKIIKNGYTIYAPDVEWALLQNPDIKEVKILNIKKDVGTNDQIICFYGGELSPNAVADYVKGSLPNSWRPDRIIKMDEVPKNLVGKPAVAKLREFFETSFNYENTSVFES